MGGLAGGGWVWVGELAGGQGAGVSKMTVVPGYDWGHSQGCCGLRCCRRTALWFPEKGMHLVVVLLCEALPAWHCLAKGEVSPHRGHAHPSPSIIQNPTPASHSCLSAPCMHPPPPVLSGVPAATHPPAVGPGRTRDGSRQQQQPAAVQLRLQQQQQRRQQRWRPRAAGCGCRGADAAGLELHWHAVWRRFRRPWGAKTLLLAVVRVVVAGRRCSRVRVVVVARLLLLLWRMPSAGRSSCVTSCMVSS